jgi:maleylacetoacetate isomerase
MKLTTYFRSSAAFRVRIAMNLKGLDYEPEFIHLAKGAHNAPEYKAQVPTGLVPALVDNGALLTQSLAIIEYLEETHPTPALLPGGALARARVRALSLLIACEIHPLNNLRSLNYLTKVLKADEDAKNTWYRHWVEDGLDKFESMLSDGQSGRFCHGDAPSMADCCLVPQVFNGQRFKADLSRVPKTMAVFEGCMKLEAFQKASPQQQPDAE